MSFPILIVFVVVVVIVFVFFLSISLLYVPVCSVRVSTVFVGKSDGLSGCALCLCCARSGSSSYVPSFFVYVGSLSTLLAPLVPPAFCQ